MDCVLLKNRWDILHKEDQGDPAFRFILPNISNPSIYIKELLSDESKLDELDKLLTLLEFKNKEINNEKVNQDILISRVNEYGSIGDQLDEIFHDIDAWKSRIQAIKDKYPKI